MIAEHKQYEERKGNNGEEWINGKGSERKEQKKVLEKR